MAWKYFFKVSGERHDEPFFARNSLTWVAGVATTSREPPRMNRSVAVRPRSVAHTSVFALIAKADGSRDNLPEIGDLSDPELQKKFPDIREYLGENPAYMGLGIKREQPRHY